MSNHLRFRAVLPCLVLLGGCLAESTAPRSPLRPGGVAEAHRLVEVTISGIGTTRVTASASFPGGEGIGPRLDLAPVDNGGGGGDGTIQMEPLAAGSFKQRESNGDLVRYLYATFRVRNAEEDGSPYDTPRQNLTFLAVSTASTLAGTPIRELLLFDGTTPADPSLALELEPTGAVIPNELVGQLVSAGPDVLQVITEVEAAAVDAPAAATSVFPYGFVVRNAGSTTTRTLPADPAAEQFDGVVTFAFKVPVQPTPAEDPYSIRLMFLPVDDTETRLTQSLEEQTPAAVLALQARASALGATTITTLGNASLPDSRRICTVRTAGPSDAPTAFLVNDGASLTSRTPDPSLAAASFLPVSSSFSATFDCALGTPNGRNFVVNGSQRGRYFLTSSYTGAGTATLTTPTGAFFPGEEVEVVLTSDLGLVTPNVARYRVGSGPASATFTPAPGSPIPSPTHPQDVVTGDVNGDGRLDLIASNDPTDGVSVFLGVGGGAFTLAPGSPIATNSPVALEIGDFDADGRLDFAVTDITVEFPGSPAGQLSIFLGDGSGRFVATPDSPIAVGEIPTSLAVGDLTGDARLDIAIASQNSHTVSVLLGDGSGGFLPAPGSPVAVGMGPGEVRMGELNGDGRLDIVVANRASETVMAFLGDGDGSFTPAPGGPIPARRPWTLALADFDEDGNQDVVVWNRDPFYPLEVWVLPGDGTGGFAAPPGVPTLVADGGSDVEVGDLDGDGHLDLALVGSVLGIWLGDGDGGFVSHGSYPAPSATAGATGDLNGDGRLDLVVSNSGLTHTLTVLLNNP